MTEVSIKNDVPSPSSDLRIRAASAADVVEVYEIVEACQIRNLTQQHIKEELSRAHVWLHVGKLNTSPCAQAFLHAHYVVDQIEIIVLATHPSARRQGLASALLGRLIDSFRRSRFHGIYLEVRQSNVAAQELYSKFGFEVTGRRLRYYTDNDEDALLMSLPL